MKRLKPFVPMMLAMEPRCLLSVAGPPMAELGANVAARPAYGRTPATAIATPENPKIDLEDWLGWHDQVLRQIVADGQPAVAFYGDSIMGGWVGEGLSPWTNQLVPLGAVDYAVPGSTTQNLLWHLQNGGLSNQPRVAVVQIGINNLGLGDSPQDVSQGVQAVLREFRRQSPGTKIIVLSLFPPNVPADRWDFRLATDHANALIEPIARRMGARFVNVSQVLTDTQGLPLDDHYVDRLHLTEAGYDAVASSILGPIVETLLQAAPRRPPNGSPNRPAPSPIPQAIIYPPPRWLIPTYLRVPGSGRFRF